MSFLGSPWTQRREIGDAGEVEHESTKDAVLIATSPAERHPPEGLETKSVQFGELTQQLPELRVGIVGLGHVSSQVVPRVAFGDVGRRLADVASQNYRVPRVLDARQRARRASAVVMLKEWLDIEDDPVEVREWEQFKKELDEDRPSSRKLFP